MNRRDSTYWYDLHNQETRVKKCNDEHKTRVKKCNGEHKTRVKKCNDERKTRGKMENLTVPWAWKLESIS